MSESGSVVDKLQLAEGERLATQFQANIRLQLTKGGMLGKKWLVGDDQNTVPSHVLVTDRRLVFLSEYSTQKRMRIAIVINAPTGRKKTHTLYGELASSCFQGMDISWLGGAKLTFAAHGAMQQQFPKHSHYVLHIPDINKKGAAALEQLLSSARTSAPVLPNSGRCELD